jgi:Flp pilus assembly protein TadG
MIKKLDARYRMRPSDSRRRGTISLLSPFAIVVLFAVVAFMVDLGYVYTATSQLQNAADSAALAAVQELRDVTEDLDERELLAMNAAIKFAELNQPEVGELLRNADISFGLWDADTNSLVDTNFDSNAVRITVRRTNANDNALTLLFGPFVGKHEADVLAQATTIFDAAGSLPLALRGPGFGPVDPKVSAANPAKDGPSEPANGEYFEAGEEVILYLSGKGVKGPVHLVLDIGTPAEIMKVLKADKPSVFLTTKDKYLVKNSGTGSGGYGKALEERLDFAWTSEHRNVLMAVVQTTSESRDAKDILDGPVQVTGFVLVHLDSIKQETLVDPDDPSKTVTYEAIMGTVLEDQNTDPGRFDGSIQLVN